MPSISFAAPSIDMSFIKNQIAVHAKESGIFVLEKGHDALIARAWLADHAQKSIEVQYFIWSSDNIGTLASEALLRAANRGVKVRVIVDDLLVDAPDKVLLALAKHPHITIRIYNPKHSVGTPWYKRAWNVVTGFRSVNQRMHDKTFIVDGEIAITGGRNMADEYFDHNDRYNFRDRDALLLGGAVKTMTTNFNTFWASHLTVSVESLYSKARLINQNVIVSNKEIKTIYAGLHAYASSTENFSPTAHAEIKIISDSFAEISERVIWGKASFISDNPGKNKNKHSLGGGGLTTSKLASLVNQAKHSIVIQSPYLVMSDSAMKIFKQALKRGVNVKISTNSMASTDNIQAFSGYRNQRQYLLKMGIEIFEYKPHPTNQHKVAQRITENEEPSIYAIHAKTMVIDEEIVYIGTFNFDPRSQNLNTEVGVIVHNSQLAAAVSAAIKTDMSSANSWNTAKDNPDQYVSFIKRSKVRFWQLMPMKPLL